MTVAHAVTEPSILIDGRFRRRNVALLSELGTAIIQDASILDGIPDGAMLVLLPANADRGFIEASIATGVDMIAKGHNVYFRHLAQGEWGIDYARIAEQDEHDSSS